MAQNVGQSIKNLYQLGEHYGFMDNRKGVSGQSQNGLKDVIDELRLAVGIADEILVNDCEAVAEWTESADGDLDVAIESTIIKRGTYSIKLTATTAETGNVMSTYIDAGAQPTIDKDGNRYMDWRNSDFIGFWATAGASGDFNAASDLQISIRNNGTWSTAQDTAVVAYDATNPIWRYIEVDISALTRSAVDAIRFENNNPDAADIIYIDEISRYKFGAGKGPAHGPCLILPIASGVSLTRGYIAQLLETAGSVARFDVEAAADTNTIGPVVVGGTGVAGGTVSAAVQVGGVTNLRTAASSGISDGDGVIWGSGHTILDVDAAANETNGFGQAIAAPAEDTTGGHDIPVIIRKNGPGHAT